MADTGGIETGVAEVTGGRLYYEAAGTGHPIVFVAGGPGESRLWDAQFGEFAPDYRVIRYDSRGGADAPAAPGVLHEMLHGLLQALGLERVCLVGHAAGGRVAINTALTYPDEVGALILVASGVEGESPADGTAPGAPDLPPGGDGPAPTPGSLPAIYRLREITVPALIVVGDQDTPHVRELADLFQAGIRNAEQVVIPGAGHLVQQEKPAEFNRAVRRFLGDA